MLPISVRPIRVYLDGINSDEPVDAYSRGDRWNGWECPFFTREQAERFAVLWTRASVGTFRAWAAYDEPTDEWTFFDSESEEPEHAKGQPAIDHHGRALRVYCIGGWAWCWVAELSQ